MKKSQRPTEVYIVGNNQTGACFYFLDREVAKSVLRAKFEKCRATPMGVYHLKEDPSGDGGFSYVFGWEQAHVQWWIKIA